MSNLFLYALFHFCFSALYLCARSAAGKWRSILFLKHQETWNWQRQVERETKVRVCMLGSKSHRCFLNQTSLHGGQSQTSKVGKRRRWSQTQKRPSIKSDAPWPMQCPGVHQANGERGVKAAESGVGPESNLEYHFKAKLCCWMPTQSSHCGREERVLRINSNYIQEESCLFLFP